MVAFFFISGGGFHPGPTSQYWMVCLSTVWITAHEEHRHVDALPTCFPGPAPAGTGSPVHTIKPLESVLFSLRWLESYLPMADDDWMTQWMDTTDRMMKQRHPAQRDIPPRPIVHVCVERTQCKGLLAQEAPVKVDEQLLL